jgi:hypothetical protein
MLEKNKFDEAKIFLQENIRSREEIIFISKILKRISEDKLEDYKPSICVVNGSGDLHKQEFRVLIGSRPLNIPYDAVEKKWKDDFGKINMELNLMIVLDEKTGSLKLEPMYNLLTLQDFCKLLNHASCIFSCVAQKSQMEYNA